MTHEEQNGLVKALEWRGTQGVWAKADALFGATYRITEYSGMAKPFKLETVGFVGPSGHYELVEEAKAAAQSDFDKRIRSTLSQPVATPAPSQDAAVAESIAAMIHEWYDSAPNAPHIPAEIIAKRLSRFTRPAEAQAVPEGWKDAFAGSNEADTELMGAAREAGWALMEIVDGIDWTKRHQVSAIIERIGKALAASPATGGA